MKIEDTVRIAFKSLKERRLRTIITILGVAIGVSTVIALIAQTVGIQESILRTLETLGPTTIVVMPSGSTVLTQVDVAKISKIPFVEVVAPAISTRGIIYQSGKPLVITVIGIQPQHLSILLGEIKLYEGSLYSPNPSTQAVLGYNIAFSQESGKRLVYIGQPMILERNIKGKFLRMSINPVGIMDKYGSTAFLSIDDVIFLSLSSLQKMFNIKYYTMILIKVENTESIEYVTDWLAALYGGNIRVITVKRITETISNITNQFGIFLTAVALVSLAVAGLGIMNIMLVSVLERTREIGILKAIGFRDRDVLILFLTQALIIGIIGGLIGIAVGVGGSFALPSIIQRMFSVRSSPGGRSSLVQAEAPHPTSFSYTPIITPEPILMSLFIAIAVSLISGLYPALRASRMDPVKALRYE